MSISASAGPLIAFGDNASGAAEYNPEKAPSVFWGGSGVLDPRPFYTYKPGQNLGSMTAGWYGSNEITTINNIPFTLAVGAVAAAAHTSNGVAMTLVSTNSSTTGVASGQQIINPVNGNLVTGLVAIEAVAAATATITGNVFTVASALAGQFGIGMSLTGTGVSAGTVITGQILTSSTVPTYTVNISQTVTSTTITGVYSGSGTVANAVAACAVPFGSAGTVCLWNPQALVARALSITANSASGTGGVFTIAGYDIYGFPMTEALTSAPGSAVTVTGKKAWKYIASITPNFTDASFTYSVNTTDIYGFPIRSDFFADIGINYTNAVITANTGYVAAVTTPSTTTTGDVRGTYTLQSSANGSNRLFVQQAPLLYNVGGMNPSASTIITGLYGVTQT